MVISAPEQRAIRGPLICFQDFSNDDGNSMHAARDIQTQQNNKVHYFPKAWRQWQKQHLSLAPKPSCPAVSCHGTGIVELSAVVRRRENGYQLSTGEEFVAILSNIKSSSRNPSKNLGLNAIML